MYRFDNVETGDTIISEGTTPDTALKNAFSSAWRSYGVVSARDMIYLQSQGASIFMKDGDFHEEKFSEQEGEGIDFDDGFDAGEGEGEEEEMEAGSTSAISDEPKAN